MATRGGELAQLAIKRPSAINPPGTAIAVSDSRVEFGYFEQGENQTKLNITADLSTSGVLSVRIAADEGFTWSNATAKLSSSRFKNAARYEVVNASGSNRSCRFSTILKDDTLTITLPAKNANETLEYPYVIQLVRGRLEGDSIVVFEMGSCCVFGHIAMNPDPCTGNRQEGALHEKVHPQHAHFSLTMCGPHSMNGSLGCIICAWHMFPCRCIHCAPPLRHCMW